jgi:hypothetical protein
MADDLRVTLSEVVHRLGRLETRVGELEGARAGLAAHTAVPGERNAVPHAASAAQAPLALVGRTLLVLAGAYLVRASTDSRALPAAVGVGLGLAYAVFWQLRADRAARSGHRESAAFHDLASSVVAFPLIWETTARFGLVSASAAYSLLLGFFALGLAVAWHRRLTANAVLTTVLALAAAVALLVSTHDLLAALCALLAIAAAVEWTAFVGLRWAAALVLDGVALLLVAVASRPALPERYAAFDLRMAAAVLLAIPLLYLAGHATRALQRGRPASVFDLVQGSVAVLVGFAGAWRVLATHGNSVAGPAAIALLLGALCYGAAFALLERRPGQGGSVFFSTAGLLLTVAGTGVLGLGVAVSLVWEVLGITAALLGRVFDRMTLRVHGALFLTAAAVPTGLVVGCAGALGGRATTALSGLAWVAALAAGVGWIVFANDPRAPRSGVGRAPQLLLALLAVFGLGKALQLGLWSLMGGRLAQDAGTAAVVRTALLAALALGLAAPARRGNLPELGWLVYPLVALGGLKLLTQDLREGRPATLVASLALYGLVLMLAPRLMKAREQRIPRGDRSPGTHPLQRDEAHPL